MNYSSFFHIDVVTAGFDGTIKASAHSGRVHSILIDALAMQFGVTIKTPSQAVASFTALHQSETGRNIAKTMRGGIAATRKLAQVLHLLLSELAQSPAKLGQYPTALPAWADPATLEAAAAARKAARRDAKQSTTSADDGATATAPQSDVDNAIATLQAAIAAHAVSPSQARAIAQLVASLQPAKPTRKRSTKANAKADTKADAKADAKAVA